jgi:hypothetical protein
MGGQKSSIVWFWAGQVSSAHAQAGNHALTQARTTGKYQLKNNSGEFGSLFRIIPC